MSGDAVADRSMAVREKRRLWLQERRKSLGSSDAPVVIGCTGSRLKIYLDKLGLLPEEEPNESMKWGLRLEDDICEAFEEKERRKVVKQQHFVRHPMLPWLTATIDGVTEDGHIVEFKSVGDFGHGARLGEDGEIEGLPEAWLAQVHHQCCAFHPYLKDYAWVAVFGPGLRLRTFKMPFDREFAAMLLDMEQAFWFDHVVAGVPPEDIVPADAQTLTRMFREDDGTALFLGDDAEREAIAYQEMGERIRSLEKDRDVAKARLLLLLGNAGSAETPSGWSIKRSVIEVGESVRKASTQIRLSVKEPR